MLLRHKLQTEISPGFCLLLAWFAMANDWKILTVILAAAAVHEAGHCLVIRAAGGRIAGLRLCVFGAVLETDSTAVSYGWELMSVLAGPAANFLCAIAAGMWMKSGRTVFVGANLVLCAFNLLPIRPLDGGRGLELAISWIWGPDAGDAVARTVGMAFAVLLSVLIVWVMYASGGSLWLLPAAAGMLGNVWRESFGK